MDIREVTMSICRRSDVSESSMAEVELAYKRKRRLRGKNRKLRLDSVTEMSNLELADKNARKGKGHHKGVMIYDARKTENLEALKVKLDRMEYHTSPGNICMRKCPCGKVRKLHKLPYYPDHIVHHAFMQPAFPVLYRFFYYDSYASVPGKGMHFAAKRVERFISLHKNEDIFFVKLDFVKFYENIIQLIIYMQMCKTFGNRGIRYLIKEIVSACESGLAIGHYPIQPFANYYTSRMIRVIQMMENYDVFISVYCDDIVVMGCDKKKVWRAVNAILDYAKDVMHQPLHDNIGMQKITKTHSLDFVGYQFFTDRVLLRKRMKMKFARAMARLHDPMRRYQVATAYKGWLMHCNGMNLWKTIMKMKNFKELKIPEYVARDAKGKRYFDATRRAVSDLLGEKLVFLDAEAGVESKFDKETIVVLAQDPRGRKVKFFTSGRRLLHVFKAVMQQNEFPFEGELYNANANGGRADYDIR